MNRFPKVVVKLEFTSRTLDIIEEGFDVQIHIGRIHDSSLALTKLGTVRAGLFAAPSYLLGLPDVKKPTDLLQHQVLALGLSMVNGKLAFRKGLESESVSPPKRLTSNDVQPLLAAANRGLGIAVLPTFIGVQLVREGKLQELLPQWKMNDVSVSAITPSARGAMPAVEQFLNLLKRKQRMSADYGATEPA
jgi:DNA-binding transcriptional LysR family regulator